MKTIIAGSRSIGNLELVEEAIEESKFEITELVSGTARGVDYLGEIWAHRNKIPITRFPANWDLYGRGAGPIRNKEMAEYAEACIVVWDGISRGSLNMIHTAEKHGLKVYVKNLSLNQNIKHVAKEKGEAS